VPQTAWRRKGETDTLANVDEGRKRVLLIAAAILAARKLSQYNAGPKVPATICAIADAVILGRTNNAEIDLQVAGETVALAVPYGLPGGLATIAPAMSAVVYVRVSTA